MWSWHWSPLTHTNLVLSPSDGLASFLKTTLANGVKVVKKVITSKFRFHLIVIYALGCFRNFSCTPVPTKITLKTPPNAREASERMSFNVIDIKQLIWKLFIYWYLMSFFHKKNVTKCLGCHLDQWLIFYWPKKFFSGQPKAGSHLRHCYIAYVNSGSTKCWFYIVSLASLEMFWPI